MLNSQFAGSHFVFIGVFARLKHWVPFAPGKELVADVSFVIKFITAVANVPLKRPVYHNL